MTCKFKYLKDNFIVFLSITFIHCFCFLSNPLIADGKLNVITLSNSDEKLYKEIFKLQSLSIKNKNSKIWKKITKLKSKINNKILFGTLDAEKYLHPTGWRSSFSDLKNCCK